MICPLDNQPCTMDHSQACYETCRRYREDERRRARSPERLPERAQPRPASPRGYTIFNLVILALFVAISALFPIVGVVVLAMLAIFMLLFEYRGQILKGGRS